MDDIDIDEINILADDIVDQWRSDAPSRKNAAPVATTKASSSDATAGTTAHAAASDDLPTIEEDVVWGDDDDADGQDSDDDNDEGEEVADDFDEDEDNNGDGSNGRQSDEGESDGSGDDSEDGSVGEGEDDPLGAQTVEIDRGHLEDKASSSNDVAAVVATGKAAGLSILKPRRGALHDGEKEHRRARVLTRGELIHLLTAIPTRLQLTAQPKHGGRLCVGMLGYPNVGKSSVINTILGVSKSTHGVVRVGVSSTPGKTKHFQTLMVNDELMLCDCPGLVFPSFMNSTGEMLCAGILPYNQMRDYNDPADVIASRVPMHLLNASYGMKIKKELDIMDNPDRPPTGSEMLCAYCAVKGFITNGTGRWDEFRAAKEILRDFTDGRVLYVCPPPGVDGVDMDRWLSDIEKVMMKREKVADRIALLRLRESEEQEANAALLDESVSGDMVFGDHFQSDAAANDAGPGGFAYDDESDDDGENASELGSSVATGTVDTLVSTKREHKRLKHWGKKNKKNKDKDPYGEGKSVSAFVAYSTNRGTKTGAMRDRTIDVPTKK
jgi:ribosome biogenesis GTPase A